MGKRKYKYPTREAAERAAEDARSEAWMWEEAFNALHEKHIAWFRGRFMTVALVNPMRAHGGIVVLQFHDSKSTFAQYMDRWESKVLELSRIGCNGPEHFAEYELCVKIRTHIRELWDDRQKAAERAGNTCALVDLQEA